MLPLTLLNAAQGLPVTVECKSGRTYAGELQACDLFMNVLLKNATEAGQTKTFDEIYLRGYAIKFVKIPDHLLDDIVNERTIKRQELRANTPRRETRVR